MTSPLDGVRVVSLTHFLQGPSCVQFLADLGADVVKVERLGGAYERHWSGAEAFVNGESVFFLLAGRNQRSIELDISQDAGRAVLWQLIERADVLVENFRPGVLDKHGFSYADVHARCPRIVYCSLSGFGPKGPARTQPGQDLLLQSLSGLAELNGREGDPPTPVGSAVVDQHAAALGALGIVAALRDRDRSGEGSKVDTSLLSAALDLQTEPFNYHLNGAALYERSPSGISSRFHQAPYGVFRTSDGWLTLSLSDGRTLAQALEVPSLSEWTRQDQFRRREELNAVVAERMTAKSTSQWEALLEKAGVWHARVRGYEDVEHDPQVVANDTVIEFDVPGAGRVRMLAHPIQYNGVRPGVRLPPPRVGEHTGQVLAQLGYRSAEIEELRGMRVIGPVRECASGERDRPDA